MDGLAGPLHGRATLTGPETAPEAVRDGPGNQTAQRMSNQAVAHKLVIVESPAKARTIAGYLGRG